MPVEPKAKQPSNMLDPTQKAQLEETSSLVM